MPCFRVVFLLLISAVLVTPLRAQEADDGITALVDILGASDDPAFHNDILKGINDALKGRRKIAMPKSWPGVYAKLKESKDEKVREQARALALVFGDTSAQDALRKALMDASAKTETRREALESLLNTKADGLAPLLQKLVTDKNDTALRLDAIKALAAYDDAKTADILLATYKLLGQAERLAALNTLAARSAYAAKLVAAVSAEGTAGANTVAIAKADVPADTIRSLRLIKDEALQKQIAGLWGVMRDTPADKLRKIDELRAILGKPSADQREPDLAAGRAFFAQTCQQCHMLFGVGGKVGPDITGSNRANLDYFLTNVVDPNAVIGKDYQAIEVRTEDDEFIVGILDREDDATLALKTTGGVRLIPKKEISPGGRKLSEKSMMPEGLLDQLKESQIRDLVAYLASPRQTPMLATQGNAFGLFNGKDLSNWDGDEKHWRVESGEIVGSSQGLKQYKYLVSQMIVENFRLKLQVKLPDDADNSGIFFRCEPTENGEVVGPQADIGQGWWGKLVDSGVTATGTPGVTPTKGRGVLWDKSGEAHVKKSEWNTYEIRAVGGKVQTWINGQLCVDLVDDKLPRRGHLALQLHVGEAMEVRMKDLELEVLP